MTLRDGMLYDGFWPSDNENPYDGLRIYKDTLLRMPAQWIDCWAAIASVKGATPVYSVASEDKIIACGDAIWHHVVGVHPSYLKAFLSGSPIGLSFDLNSLSDDTFLMLKEFISEFKAKRRLYKSATARLIADTETVIAIEYADKNLDEIEVVLFVNRRVQDGVTLYPLVDTSKNYLNAEGEKISGKEIAEEGISFEIKHSYTAFNCMLRSVKE